MVFGAESFRKLLTEAGELSNTYTEFDCVAFHQPYHPKCLLAPLMKSHSLLGIA